MTNDSKSGESPSKARDSKSSEMMDEAELDIADYLRGENDESEHHPVRQSVLALAVGAVGVVYGDIGTSPLYAFREALRPIAHDGVTRADVLGVLSLLIWTLVITPALRLPRGAAPHRP